MTKLQAEIAAGRGMALEAVRDRIPADATGRPLSRVTLYGWVQEGVRTGDGRVVRLEAAKVGRRWFTSEGAIERFVAGQQRPEVGRCGVEGKEKSE